MELCKEVKIKILIVLAVCLLLVGIARFFKQNLYNSSQLGRYSLWPTWNKGHFSSSFLLQMENYHLKADSSRLSRLLRSILPDEDSHKTILNSSLKDSTFWEAFGRDWSDSWNQQPLLKDAFPHLNLVIVLLIIFKASFMAVLANNANYGRKNFSYLEKYVPIELKSALRKCISSSVCSIDEKICKEEEDFHLHSGKKNAWMYTLRRRVDHHTDCWIFSVLQRVASYRPLSTTSQSANTFSYVSLAEAGFRYPGTGSLVECQDCRSLVDITSFDSPAVEAKYHREGCSYMKGDVLGASNGTLPSNREEEASNSSLPSNREEEASNSSLPSNQEEEASNSSLPSNQEEDAFNNVHQDNEDTYSAADAEDEREPLNEQAAHNEHLTVINNDNSNTSLGTRPKNLMNDHDMINQLSNGVSSPVTPLTNNSVCPEAAGGTGPQVTPAVEDERGFAVPLDQQPHHFAASVQQTNPATLLDHEQIDETVVQGHEQTNEATSTKQPQNISVTSSQEMGACAAPEGSGHLTAATDSSNFNAQLFDLDQFTPEHEDYLSAKQDSRISCDKNPGHYANIPMQHLQLDHIPSNVRVPEVLTFFNLVGKLIVRLEVGATSPSRPDVSEQKGAKKRFGTGMAITKSGENDLPVKDEESGKWNTLKKRLKLGKSNGFIYILTSRHLIFDNHEAKQTVVEFFYDNQNRRGIVTAKGVSIEHSQILGDFTSILKCKVYDLSMLEFVKNTENEIRAFAGGFPQRIKEGLMKRVFVIGHPHGGEKMLSYGEYVMVKYAMKIGVRNGQRRPEMVKINNHTQISPENSHEIRKVLLYTADTCKGSSGAAVISFKKIKVNNTEHIVMDLWMHNGVCKKHSLNATVMRELTSDDIVNHGHTETFRSTVQEEQNAEAERAANQVISCPVFVVIGPPSHPVYAVCRKRLESYPDPFNHVHRAVELADAGFFYAGYDDCVRCFQCGLGLRSWKSGDSIFEEHYRNRPDCQFLQMKLKASGINPLSLQSLDQSREIQTPAQPQTTASPGNENSQHQQPNLTMLEQPTGAQSSQRRPGKDSMPQPQIMKYNTDLVPNGSQEITIGMASGSTNNSRDLVRSWRDVHPARTVFHKNYSNKFPTILLTRYH